MLHLILQTTTLIISLHISHISSQSSLCRGKCGGITINYPFGIDDGCGHRYYRRLLICTDLETLELRTPSGRYPVQSISYTDPHIVVSDPYIWGCQDGPNFRPTKPFSLDPSTHLTLSRKNEYLFLNCSQDHVLMGPRAVYCDRFPDQCDSWCDSSSYLCRNLPECSSVLEGVTCCSYFPKAIVSLRLMLEYCASYTSIHWKEVDTTQPLNRVAEYGIRVDFEIPVTMKCLMCDDLAKGGGKCGFDARTEEFLCLCEQGNATTFCKDRRNLPKQSRRRGAVAGTVAVSVAGAIGIGAGVLLYLKQKVRRASAPVTCGVQSNENRIF
ncbi:hypothetical protein Droror1_Dr00010606 [Drosera rotundifolia]